MNFNLFKRKKEVRDLTPTKEPNLAGGVVLDWLTSTQSGLNISTYYRGVVLISNSIAQLPILTKKTNSKSQTNILKNHPSNLLWTDASNPVDKVTMIRNIVSNVINKGNAYLYIQRGEDGTPTSLRYLMPSDVMVDYKKETNTLRYTCSYINHGKAIPMSDMLHFKLFTLDGVNGISVPCYADHQIKLTNAANQEALEFTERGSSKTSGVLKVQSQLSEKQREQILSTWHSTFSSSKAGLAVIQGNMEYQPLQISPADAELLGSRAFNQEDICQFLNIDPVLLGLKGYQNYTNFEDANNSFLTKTLMPYINMIETELTRKLLNESERKSTKIILDSSEYLRANKQAESAYYSTLCDKGILTRNEIRLKLGFAPVEGGDSITVSYTDIAQNTIGGKTENDNNKEEE